MGSFSIKKLEPSEPLNLYADLDKSIEFGEYFATSVLDSDRYGKIYYLGGLEVYNLNSANLSEETIARLYNALESGNIYYAVFPDDQRRGRLPLVLNKKTRAFIKTLPELLDNKAVKWYLYQLPGDIDPDNNERRGSSFVTDDDENEIELTFDEIENHINNYGFVKEQDNAFSVFTKEDEEDNSTDIKDIPSPNTSNEKTKETETNQASKTPLKNDNENEDSPEKHEMLEDEFEKTMFEDEEFENPNTQRDEDDVDYEEVFAEPSSRNTNTHRVNDGDLELSQNQSFAEPDVTDIAMSADVSVNDGTEEVNASTSQKVSEREMISHRTKQYIELPQVVEDIIEDISLPKFTAYPSKNVYAVTSNTMEKEVNDSNKRIEGLKQSIKNEAKQLYRDYMYEAYLSITNELNTETGNDNVKDAYHRYVEAKNQLDEEFDQEMVDKKAELEEIFYGQAFENYKDEINAQIQKWYEDEYYQAKVSEPLEDYKNNRKSIYDDRKLERTNDFNDWLNTVEDTAIGQDQQKAIKKVTDFIQHRVNESMAHIETLQRRMDEVNQSLSQIEYQARAEENIRKNFGTELAQDEQAKIYKQKLDTAIDEKAELDAAFKKFEAETKEQHRAMKSSHEKEINEIKQNHDEVIENLKKEKETIEKDNREKEENAIKARQDSDSHARKTGVKFAGVAALATAIVVGGCSMVTNHSKVSDNESKIEQQQKQIKNSKSELSQQKKDLKSKDNEIQAQKDKVKKAEEKAKKAENNKDKKSKKDK